MLPVGGVLGVPWGPCTAAQGTPLTLGAGLGACAPEGTQRCVLSDCRDP